MKHPFDVLKKFTLASSLAGGLLLGNLTLPMAASTAPLDVPAAIQSNAIPPLSESLGSWTSPSYISGAGGPRFSDSTSQLVNILLPVTSGGLAPAKQALASIRKSQPISRLIGSLSGQPSAALKPGINGQAGSRSGLINLICHSRESGNPVKLDPCFRRGDIGRIYETASNLSGNPNGDQESIATFGEPVYAAPSLAPIHPIDER